jgi:pimeloyl-ACP methyl ester carboxylesterase
LGPVTDPWDPESRLITPEVERQWFENGEFPIVSSEDGQPVGVHSRFLRELREFVGSSFVLGVPVLVVHGVRDTVVSKEQSVRFARNYPSVELVLLDEEHQLLENPGLFLDVLERFMSERYPVKGQLHV